MRKILDIYEEYKIMPNLAEHMLRAAAVASMICDNFEDPLPKEDIITACILHDMGNIIKSNFEFLPELLEPLGREYWQKVKDEYIAKYGPNEHDATVKILREIGVPENIVSLADQDRFALLCEQSTSSDMAPKIVQYSDLRAAPLGIVSYEERMEEARGRYKLQNQTQENERQRLVECGRQVEKQIFARCRIKPKDITEQSAAPFLGKLRNFEVKTVVK